MNIFPATLSGLLFSAAVLAQSPLETTFVGGFVVANPPPAGVTQYFDLQVVNPQGIALSQIDINFSANSSPTGNFDVWITAVGGTLVGNEQTASVWTLASAQTPTVAAGRNAIQLNSPIYFAPGTYGIALHSVGFNPVYTNPATQTPTLPASYSNADITIDCSAARSRASLANDPFGGTSNGFSPRQPNIALHYSPGAATVDFTSDVTGGISPLTVQFTALGVSANPGGILGWAWDFDNDGTIDSNSANPTHTYACGTYTVSLTMIDGAGTYTETKTDYIDTDVLTPDFGVTAVSPNVLQFTDLTTPAAQTWAWDFNNDGTIDSTSQNPIFNTTAAFCSELDVALTVSRACKAPVTMDRKTAVAKSLATVFGGGTYTTATATGGINFFDLQVTNPEGVSLCALHTHTQGNAGTNVGYNLYVTDGTYVGNETSPDPWTLIATENVAGAGGGEQTFVPLTQSVYLAPGTYGVALEHVGNSPRYTNLGGVQTFSNADLTITAGATQAEPLFSTGTLFTPRIANVGLYYTDCSFTNQAGYGWIADGCVNSLGVVSSNTATSLPRIGQNFSVEVSSAPAGASLFYIGFDRTTSPLGPLPFDLGPVGAPGCSVRINPDSGSLLLGSAGSTLTFSLNIPNNTVLLCTQFYTQGFNIDTGFNNLGITTSDSAAGIVGQ